MIKMKHVLIGLFSTLDLLPTSLLAQEKTQSPYVITYDHHMEEVDALEIASGAVFGRDREINTFVGVWHEFEYGARKWWTTEFYIDWQHTRHEGSVFTGVRFENRFRPFLESHWINPVLYVEYEHLNGADRILKEIVGFDSKDDLTVPNNEARQETEHELETKLILSSDIGLWNVSENFIGVKNIHEGRWEFGYSAGIGRTLAAPSGNRCTLCLERLSAGIEMYGGLGEWGRFTLGATSHYIAPVFLWNLPSETMIRVSPGWGITSQSVGSLFRIEVSQEFDDIGRRIGKLFH
jgi:hypothetical protein